MALGWWASSSPFLAVELPKCQPASGNDHQCNFILCQFITKLTADRDLGMLAMSFLLFQSKYLASVIFLITITDLFEYANALQTIWLLLSERSGARHSNRLPLRGELASVDSRGKIPPLWVTSRHLWWLSDNQPRGGQGQCHLLWNLMAQKKMSLQMFLPSLKRKNTVLAPGWDEPCVCLQLGCKRGRRKHECFGFADRSSPPRHIAEQGLDVRASVWPHSPLMNLFAFLFPRKITVRLIKPLIVCFFSFLVM